MLQWYVNVPALANVWENVAPPARLPLSNEESSAVTVCVAAPVFVQVTEVPTLTVIDPGSKPKSTTLTADPPPVPEPPDAADADALPLP